MKTKRPLAVLLLILTSFGSVHAQIGQYRSELALGASAGYVMSQVGFMPEVPQLWHGGPTGGITLRYTSEKYFSSICAIVAEVNYAKIGWKEDILTPNDQPVINTKTGQPETYQRDQTYIQVPFLARLGWGRERKGFQFFFQAGPQAGFFLSENTKKSFDLSSMNMPSRTSKIVAQDTMNVERRIDYGITAGIGLEFSHPKAGHFIIEGRYYYGLGDIYGNSKSDYFGRSNFSNIVVKFTYLFDLFKSDQPIK